MQPATEFSIEVQVSQDVLGRVFEELALGGTVGPSIRATSCIWFIVEA